MTKAEAHITCFKKKTYLTLIDAELDAAQMWADKKWDNVPYKCNVCPFFHMSSKGWSISRIEWARCLEKRMKKFKRGL